MRSELKKVVWPDGKTTAKNTGTVLLCSVAVGACIWIFDGVAALLIKTYVDAHFTEPELSLDQVGAACGYHPKYVSAVFKSAYGIGFSDHLNTLRIGRACAMMEQGVTGIKSIALLCGYRDPLYFSKLFRARMGMTPRAYIQKAAEK